MRASSRIKNFLDLRQLQFFAAVGAEFAQEVRKVRIRDRHAVHQFWRRTKLCDGATFARGGPSRFDRIGTMARACVLDHASAAYCLAGEHQPRFWQVAPNLSIGMNVPSRLA